MPCVAGAPTLSGGAERRFATACLSNLPRIGGLNGRRGGTREDATILSSLVRLAICIVPEFQWCGVELARLAAKVDAPVTNYSASQELQRCGVELASLSADIHELSNCRVLQESNVEGWTFRDYARIHVPVDSARCGTPKCEDASHVFVHAAALWALLSMNGALAEPDDLTQRLRVARVPSFMG